MKRVIYLVIVLVLVQLSAAATVDLRPFLTSIGNTNNIAPGQGLNTTVELHNYGTTLSDSSWLGYYVSDDSFLNAGDVLIDSIYLPSINAGSWVTKSKLVYLPLNTGEGTKYILFYADYKNQVVETNDSNNTAVGRLKVRIHRPDLQCGIDFISPAQLSPGSNFSPFVTTFNYGDTISMPGKTGFYYSNDNTFSNDDILLGVGTFDSITISHFYQYWDTTFGLPQSATAGAHYILAYADYDNEIDEYDETNNVAAYPILVVAPFTDLELNGVDIIQATTHAGDNVTVPYLVRNWGTITSPAIPVQFFLSVDTVVDGNDILLGTAVIDSLPNSALERDTATFLVPLHTLAGPHYIIPYVNYNHGITETYYTNNYQAKARNILQAVTPDLNFAVLPNVHQLTAGDTAALTFTLRNSGPVDAYDFNIAVVISTDTIFSFDDVPMAIHSLHILPAGNVHTYYDSLLVPAQIAPGNYYLLFFADSRDSVVEGNEMNNLRYLPVAVNGTTGIETTNTDALVRIEPNPATNRLLISTNFAQAETLELHIYNTNGQLCLSQIVAGGTQATKLDVSNLNAGVYVTQLHGHNGQIITRKLTIAR